jgi:hypothetical protein
MTAKKALKGWQKQIDEVKFYLQSHREWYLKRLKGKEREDYENATASLCVNFGGGKFYD